MTSSILITQCLQNDFVKPIGRYDPMPNLLHVGHEEARRLMGENPSEGPVARVMQWAYRQTDEQLKIIHLRDWHDPSDPRQASHLKQFGAHCIQGTEGARFAFEEIAGAKKADVVNSLTLNDFVGTDLEEILRPFEGGAVRVGLAGVWTEAKVTFLAYELHTRHPDFQIAVCSAITASSSRAQHFIALEQMEKLLGVKIHSSIGEFIGFLGGESAEAPLLGMGKADHPQIEIESGPSPGEADRKLLRYLFRDCRSARFRCLDGGFSGNVVMGTQSVDSYGHPQVPHVVKIGPQALIGRERAAFERIESVLGNSAPRIADFADYGDRGGIKYRYASMGGGISTTFQKLYMKGLPMEKVRRILKTVFFEQLGRFYAAASRERCDLIEYYAFKPDMAPRVQKRVEAVLGGTASGRMLRFSNGREFPNLVLFYSEDLSKLPSNRADSVYFSYLHGDLNGANIIVDGQENVWLIDFFHTHRGHILQDLIKLENDLLYIFTPVTNQAEFDEALRLTDLLMTVEDIARPMSEAGTALGLPQFVRAYETLCFLRSFYPDLIQSDRNPLQLFIGQMRYAAHTLSFDESNDWQKKWALYTASLCGAQVLERLQRIQPLCIEWIDGKYTASGKLGITILPGRRDHKRDMDSDLEVIRNEKITHVLCLLSETEFAQYGVEGLLERYRAMGIQVRHAPILDQKACSVSEMKDSVGWLDQNLRGAANILVHCVGGLGRSGMVAACYLKSRGCSAQQAIEEVRRVRSLRAIESKVQEDLIATFEIK